MKQPILVGFVMRLDDSPRQIDRQTAAQPMVVEKITFDDVAFVAQGDGKFLVPESGIEIHDVPQHGMATDFDHRLRLQPGLFLQPRAQATGKYRHLHEMSFAANAIDRLARSVHRHEWPAPSNAEQ